METLDVLEKQHEQYPDPIKQMHKLVKTSALLGYFDVSYPSLHMGKDYLAFAGDGLFLFALRVLGDDHYEVVKNRVGKHVTSYEKQFLHHTKTKYGDILNTEQVLEGIRVVFKCSIQKRNK